MSPEQEREHDVNLWIEKNFAGHGVAVRFREEHPIPGEPFMSIEQAKDLVRRAVAEFCANQQIKQEQK